MQDETEKNSGRFDDANGFMPTSFSTAYTTAWLSSRTEANPSINPPAATEGSAVVCASADLYVKAVRREARWRAEKKLAGIISNNSNPRLRVEAEFVRTPLFLTADLIKVNIPSHGVEDRNMRLREISYDDYKTVLSLEDDKAIVGSV